MREIGYHWVDAFSCVMLSLSISNFVFYFVADLVVWHLFALGSLFSFHYSVSIRLRFDSCSVLMACVATGNCGMMPLNGNHTAWYTIHIIASNGGLLSGMCFQPSYERQTSTSFSSLCGSFAMSCVCNMHAQTFSRSCLAHSERIFFGR